MLHGKCRCCRKAGEHRDIFKEYNCDGTREVYFDVFLECFNVFISTSSNRGTLICMDCIQKLRDASNFRKMVVDAEKHLQFANDPPTLETQSEVASVVKLEPVEPNDDNDYMETEYKNVVKYPLDAETQQKVALVKQQPDDNDDDYMETEQQDIVKYPLDSETHQKVALVKQQHDDDDDDYIETEQQDIVKYPLDSETHQKVALVKQQHDDDDDDYMETEQQDIVKYPLDSETQQKVALVKQQHDDDDDDYIETEQQDIGTNTRSKNIKAQLNRVTELESKQKNEHGHLTEKAAHVHNAQIILEHSNVTAFKGKSRAVGLPCFYCKYTFDNIQALRTHQKEHKKSDINKSLNSVSPYCFIVNVDIADLTCTLCDASLNTLEDFKSHLESEHNKMFYTKFEDRVIPFKLPMDNNYICQICGLKFESFGAIQRHMNGHFRNYNCDQCDRGFVTHQRLNTHVKTIHVEGSFQCETCKKVFSTQQKHKSHVDTVHKNVKRFKCTKCPERFTAYFQRYQHLVKIHGQAELEYKCNVCDKIYKKKCMLSQHVKRDHLEERSIQCAICFDTFFARKELTMHMVKHNGARTFECTVCKKAYARKKTLTEHMRIHNNDRRFSCAVCGLAFVQNCSLKGHMKTHHPEHVS